MKSKYLLLIFLFTGVSFSQCKNNGNEDITMSREEIVHALVQMATVKGVLEVSDPNVHDSLFQVYKTEVEKLTQKDYEVIVRNLRILEGRPDSLSVFQTQALDTLRKLQNTLLDF